MPNPALEIFLSVKAGRPRINLIGRRFGKLVVIDFISGNRWKIQCDCGRVYNSSRNNFQRQKSCGCMPSNTGKPGTALRSCYGYYVIHARENDRIFALTLEQFETITSSRCHYCNCEPKQIRKAGSGEIYLYNGVDRKDNGLGYTVENSLPCCFFCNSAKRNKSYEEFLLWIETVCRNRRLPCP